MAYDPPENNNIPFNFTDKGYEAPTDELLFNFKDPLEFGDLQAAINVLQLHQDEHYVYDTTCPKYVVGYKNGRVQIIKGPCTQHALRDLGATLTPQDFASTTGDLPAKIIGLLPDASKDLPAEVYAIPPRDLQGIIGTHDPENLPAEINAILRKGQEDLGASIDTHDPGDLQAIIESHDPGGLHASIRPWYRGIISDLPATLNAILNKGDGDIGGIIGGHLPGDLPAYIGGHRPGDLAGIIQGWVSDERDLPAEIIGELFHGEGDLGGIIGAHLPGDLSAYIFGERRPAGNLPAYIWGHEQRNLGAIIDTHLPRDLQAFLGVRQHTDRDLPAYLRGWQASDLPASINTVVTRDLSAYLETVQPVDLPAYLRVQPTDNLPGRVRGWGYADLGATVNVTFYRDLTANIAGHDVFSKLRAYIRGVGDDQLDLGAYIRPFHYRELGGFLQPRYINNLQGIIFAIAPKDLKARLHGWQEEYLLAEINAQDYPYNLRASISSNGRYRDLGGIIDPVQQTYVQRDLGAYLDSWEQRYLGAHIYVDKAGDLGAYLNPLGYSSDLHASIYPKMIRLTTYIAIATMEHLDLSAIINAACMQSAASDLGAFMYVKYKGDLGAYIKPIVYNYKPTNLSASVGYADAYTEVDKYKFSISIKESEFFTEDMYKVVIHTLDNEHFLSASITGTPLYTDLTAQIQADKLPVYTFKTHSINRERVVNKTYDQILKDYKVVEFAFEDMVKDYHYSSEGNYAWKINQHERWMLSVESYIPASQALQIARKFYKSTTVYNFADFNSVDEAIRHAIAYVTEQPIADLNTFINAIGYSTDLGASIGVRSVITGSRESLAGSITGHARPIVVGTPSGVGKI